LSTSNPVPELRADDALRTIGALFEPGDVIEIRALDVGRTLDRAGSTYAGYFNFENGDAIAPQFDWLMANPRESTLR
jgi:hypothetical protein